MICLYAFLYGESGRAASFVSFHDTKEGAPFALSIPRRGEIRDTHSGSFDPSDC